MVDDGNDEKEGSKTGSSDCTSDSIVLKKSLILELSTSLGSNLCMDGGIILNEYIFNM